MFAHDNGFRQAFLRTKRDAQAQQLHVMVGVIDSANEGSIRFHRAFGFEPCGKIREVGYKFGRWLDVEPASTEMRS